MPLMKSASETRRDAIAPTREREAADNEKANGVLLSLLPWGGSLLFHLGLVFLAIFVVWSTSIQQAEDDAVIPVVGTSPIPNTPIFHQADRKPIEFATRHRITPNHRPQQKPLANQTKALTTLIGFKDNLSMKPNPFSVANPEAAPSGLYRTPMGNARRIVYLIDASGSLIDSLPFVINELKRCIGDLTEKHSFTVIFFQGDDIIEVPSRGMKQADDQTKRQVMRWISIDSGNITPQGRSNPVSAVKAALAYDPQLVFLLSDDITGQGQYEVYQQRLLHEIEKTNRAHAKINTIQFLYPDPLAGVGIKPTLQVISERTGGVYKFVDGRELGIQ